MPERDAKLSGQFNIGDITINRLGFGAMRILGPNNWGPPLDRTASHAILRRAVDLGVNFIDTADTYGPDVSEELIREALHPYDGILIATKAGFNRSSWERWIPNGRPEHLIEQAKRSLKKLRVDRIDLWQLHRIDPNVPADEQFGAVRQLLDEEIIRYAGLSEVPVPQIEAAKRVFPVMTVQNRYNLVDRQSEHIVNYCAANGIGFIPWFPLAGGPLAQSDGVLASIAKAHQATMGQVALAWLLQRSPVILPIPGTRQIAHLEENVTTGSLILTEDEMDDLYELGFREEVSPTGSIQT